jgi:hypothetical protein
MKKTQDEEKLIDEGAGAALEIEVAATSDFPGKSVQSQVPGASPSLSPLPHTLPPLPLLQDHRKMSQPVTSQDVWSG